MSEARHAPSRSSRNQAIDSALARGEDAPTIAAALRLSLSHVQQRASLFRAERRDTSTDMSCPRFSHDDACIAAVMAHGGFPRIDFDRACLVGPNGGLWRPMARAA